MRAMRLILALGVTAFMLVPAGIRAQIAGTANVQGTVSDSSGAVVPRANVALTNEATSVKRTTASDASGVYSFPAFPSAPTTWSSRRPASRPTSRRASSSRSAAASRSIRRWQWAAASRRSRSRPKGLALQTEDATFKQTIDQRRSDRDAAQRPADDSV